MGGLSLIVDDDSRLVKHFWIAYSSLCSRSSAPVKPRIAASLGKMPTASARRLISPFNRSSTSVLWIFTRCFFGKSMIVSTSCSAIPATIAYADSVTACQAQVERQQHNAAAAKLLRSAPGNAFPVAQERRIRRLLGRKDEAQDGVHAIALVAAQQVLADLDAFAAWAHDVLPKAAAAR